MKPVDQSRRGMTYWQLIVYLILILLPFALFGAVGAWALWDRGQLLWLTWTIPVSWGLAWLVVRRRDVDVPLLEFGSREHWTPKDHAAADIVEAEYKRLDGVTGEMLIDVAFYRERTLELARKLARFYNPNATDPLDKLSVVEILTVAQLVAADMEEWFQKYVPGSHLITVQQWRLLSHAPGLWAAAMNVTWIASVILNPASIARYAMSKAFVDPVTKKLQSGLLAAFFTYYLRQVGYYLIELNSGRLRGGTARFRGAMHQLEFGATGESVDIDTAVEPITVTIAIVGQVKAGKSSLVNCLLENQRAAVDVLPLTKGVDRYELKLEDSNDRLILLDTPGYSDAGATREQIDSTREAVRQADLILLVMAATSPAKQADMSMVDGLNSWFREQHRLKPPPMIGVVSKIDGLRPVMEWSPPYDWEHPSRPKAQSIRDAVDYVQQAAGDRLPLVVPVCTDRQRGHVYGIEEWLLPMLIVQLDEARAVSLVRSLHRDYDSQRLQKTMAQFVEVGRRITDAIRKSVLR